VADKSTEKPTYFDSIASAAAALQIPVDTLRAAKSAGAPGFRGSRVYPADLVPWLQAQDKGALQDDKRTLERKKLLLQCERIAFQNDVERGRYVEKSVFVSALIQLGSEQKALLRQKLESELPGVIPGLEAGQRSEAKSFCKRVVDDVCGRTQRLVDKWKI
jgi:hypothetical protein